MGRPGSEIPHLAMGRDGLRVIVQQVRLPPGLATSPPDSLSPLHQLSETMHGQCCRESCPSPGSW
jgi:hypothetical protein